jgi:hypothetical protein
MPTESSSQEIASYRVRHNLLNTAPARVIVLLLLFTSAALREAAHLTSLADTDIWWHLRTGLWILQSHAVPHAGLFSQYSDLPWIASSWGYEVLAATAYNVAGLRAIPVLLMCFKVVLAGMTYLLARGSRKNFWPAVIVSAAAQYAIGSLPPSPVLCSVVLFAIELMLLFESRRTGNPRALYWLPLLFLIWANLHLQFMNGLLVLVVFGGAVLSEYLFGWNGVRGLEGRAQALPLAQVSAMVGASFVATLLTPYTYHLYQRAALNASSGFIMSFNQELRSLPFRQPEHYVLLLLAMGAFLALGLQRSRDLCKIFLMIVCASFAFAIQRDTWFVVLPSLAIIGEALKTALTEGQEQSEPRGPDLETFLTAGLVLVVFVVAAVGLVPSSQALLGKASERYPVKACDFIRQNHLTGSIFNNYQWGGFLIWYLPDYPVAIDDRQDLYGDEVNERYVKVMQGQAPTDSDPTFANASIFLLHKEDGMVIGLSRDPNYQVIYGDDLARILRRR